MMKKKHEEGNGGKRNQWHWAGRRQFGERGGGQRIRIVEGWEASMVTGSW